MTDKLKHFMDWDEGTPPPNGEEPEPGTPPKKRKNAFLVGRHGRPRRAHNLAQHCSVRLDPVAKSSLTREFGSLGNALHFLFEGIQDQRKKVGIQTEETSFEKFTLYRKELHLILESIKYHIENGLKDRTFEHGGATKKLKAIGTKIYVYLYKD